MKRYFKNPFRMHIVYYIVIILLPLLFTLLLNNYFLADCYQLMLINKYNYSYTVECNRTIEKNSYYNLTSKNIATINDYYINSDIYMQLNNGIYDDGLFNFDINGNIIQLASNQCAVSKNILIDKHLSLGDTIQIGDSITKQDIVITEILPYMSGMGEAYVRDGIIVIGYNEALKNSATSFFSFGNESGVFFDATIVYKTEQNSKLCKNIFGYYLGGALVLLVGYALIVELLFEKDKLQTYFIFKGMGMRKNKIKALIYFEQFLKYSAIPIIFGLISSIMKIKYFGYVAFCSFGLLIISSLGACLITSMIHISKIIKDTTYCKR